MRFLLRKARVLIWLMIAAGFVISARGQDQPNFEFPSGHPLIAKAVEAVDKEQYHKSALLFAAAIRELRTERWSLYYLAACNFALAGKRDASFLYLDGAISRGF